MIISAAYTITDEEGYITHVGKLREAQADKQIDMLEARYNGKLKIITDYSSEGTKVAVRLRAALKYNIITPFERDVEEPLIRGAKPSIRKSKYMNTEVTSDAVTVKRRLATFTADAR